MRQILANSYQNERGEIITERLSIKNAKDLSELPHGLHVEEHLTLHNVGLRELPAGAKVGSLSLTKCPDLVRIPRDFTVQMAFIDGCQNLTSLPPPNDPRVSWYSTTRYSNCRDYTAQNQQLGTDLARSICPDYYHVVCAEGNGGPVNGWFYTAKHEALARIRRGRDNFEPEPPLQEASNHAQQPDRVGPSAPPAAGGSQRAPLSTTASSGSGIWGWTWLRPSSGQVRIKPDKSVLGLPPLQVPIEKLENIECPITLEALSRLPDAVVWKVGQNGLHGASLRALRGWWMTSGNFLDPSTRLPLTRNDLFRPTA